jgi:hypothetical protein
LQLLWNSTINVQSIDFNSCIRRSNILKWHQKAGIHQWLTLDCLRFAFVGHWSCFHTAGSWLLSNMLISWMEAMI